MKQWQRLKDLGRSGAETRSPGRPSAPLFGAVLALLAVAAGGPPCLARAVPFATQSVISTAADSPLQVVAADLDGDGDLDVLSASATDDKIAWYENTGAGTFGGQQTISNTADFATSVAAADLDGDGDLDVVSASRDDDKIAWYRNPDGAGGFVLNDENVVSTTADGAQSVIAADIDGDGDPDLVAATADDDRILWYENTDGAGTFSSKKIISTIADDARSVFAADLDRDGDLDVLSASAGDDKISWYDNTLGDGSMWTETVISTAADSARSVFAADLDHDGDLDVLSASADDDKIAWYENDGTGLFGAQRVISGTLDADDARSVFAADVDGDGDLDVVAASAANDWISWYENNGGGGFPPFPSVISILADNAFSVFAADVDGDGDTDVLSASNGDDEVAWYENRTIHRSAVFAPQAVISSARQRSVTIVDLDRDGDLDVLGTQTGAPGTISWFENSAAAGTSWTERSVTTGGVAVVSTTHAADLDGDGAPDLLAVVGQDVEWFHNDGTGGFGPAGSLGAVVLGMGPALATADVDGDGDLDVFSASEGDGTTDGEIAWYENTNGAGLFGPPQPIAGLPVTCCSTPNLSSPALAPVDVDGDGDVDLLASGGGDVAWFENTDAAGTFVLREVLAQGSTNRRDLAVGDIDGDGDLDVAVGNSLRLAWYPNDGAGTFGTQQVVDGPIAFGFRGIGAADLDEDGDLDLFASRPTESLDWYENLDGNGSFGPARVVDGALDASLATAADLDSDGDLDIIGSMQNAGLDWYENRGGQFALSTVSLAQGVAADDQTIPVFQIDLEHRGRVGDSPVALHSLGLRFEDGAGAILSLDELQGLIAAEEFFLDDGSGDLDGADEQLEIVDPIIYFGGGILRLVLRSSGNPVEAAVGESRRLFLRLQVQPDASTQTPDSFEVFHPAAISTMAFAASVSLTLEYAEATTTGKIDTHLTTSSCTAPFELDLEGFSVPVSASVVCEAGTTLTATEVVVEAPDPGSSGIPASLSLWGGQEVALAEGVIVEEGATLTLGIDPGLAP